MLDSANSDTALGLTLGWRYIEHEPIPVDSFEGSEGHFREAEIISDANRARILLETGYSKRELRAALKRQSGRNPDVQSSFILEPLRGRHTKMVNKISKGTKHFLKSFISEYQFRTVA
jgi:hypothetical protein